MSNEKDVPTHVYEVGFHVVSSIPEEDVGQRVAEVHDMIEKHGGVIISEEFPKHMELAYGMVKEFANQRKTYASAYFGWVKFEAPSAAPGGVKKLLDEHKDILRHVIIKTVKENTLIPKKLAQQAGRKEEDRDERPKKAEEVKQKPMTDEELDKTIDELASGEALKV